MCYFQFLKFSALSRRLAPSLYVSVRLVALCLYLSAGLLSLVAFLVGLSGCHICKTIANCDLPPSPSPPPTPPSLAPKISQLSRWRMSAAEHGCEKDREREKEIERVLEMGVSISEMEQAIFDLMSHRLMDSFIAYIEGV